MPEDLLNEVETQARAELRTIRAKGLDRNSSCNLPVFRMPGPFIKGFVRLKTGPKPKAQRSA